MSVWRKRFVRWLGWWIAAAASVFAIGLLVLATYLMFFDYPESLRRTLESELSRIAGAPASIGSIDLDITGYAFELTDISVGETDDGARPILVLDRIWGRLRLSEIVRLRLHWTELVVQGLALRLVAGADAEFVPGESYHCDEMPGADG